MEYLFYGLLLVGIPATALLICRSAVLGLFIACGVGCALLAGWMVYAEARAPDSDFDAIFMFGVILWCAGLAVYYGVWAALFAFGRRVVRRRIV